MILLVAMSAALLAEPYTGQVVPFHGPNAVGERHRYEMDRLRGQADRRADFARRHQLESRLTVLDLQAARRPEPVSPAPIAPRSTVEEARARREAETRRREAMVEGVGQIDAWLDRPQR